MPPQIRSPFPQTNRSTMWLTIVNALQSDPVLHTAVDTWQVWDGSESATAEPTEENLPLFRMEPAGGSQRWADENTQECTLNLKISLGVEGTDITVMYDFWGAIEAALFTGNTLLYALESSQVIQKTITEPGIVPRLFGQKSGLAATGTLTVKMRINS